MIQTQKAHSEKKVRYRDIMNDKSKSLSLSNIHANIPFHLNVRPSFTQRIIVRPLQLASATALYTYGKFLQKFGSITLSLTLPNMYKSTIQTFAGVFLLTSLHTGIQEVFHNKIREYFLKSNQTYEILPNQDSKQQQFERDPALSSNNRRHQESRYSGFVISNVLASLTLFPLVNILFKIKIKKDLASIHPGLQNKNIYIESVIKDGSAFIRTNKILLIITLYSIFSEFFISFKRYSYLHNDSQQIKPKNYMNKIQSRNLNSPQIDTKMNQLSDSLSNSFNMFFSYKTKSDANKNTKIQKDDL